MRRRKFLAVVSGAAATWPLAARAQLAPRRIGIFMGLPESDPEAQGYVAAFRDSLRKLGWMDGRNIRIDTRWATIADAEALRRSAKELVALEPDLILSNTTFTTTTLLQQTRTIPLIFTMVTDPIGNGFVASFPRPGGNVTGFVVMEPAIASKWVELLKEIAPRVNKATVLFHPASTYAENYLAAAQAAGRAFGIEVIAAPVRNKFELEAAVSARAREPNGGFIVVPDGFTDPHRVEITSLAARHRLPAVYGYRFFAALGGLLSYGINLTDNFSRAATYADRILRSEKPADLPVQAPNKYMLTINLKTAKELGLDVPLLLQQLADEVIE